MPMIPTQGVQSAAGFGPGAAPQLGTGGYASQDAMGGPTADPSATVEMQQMPQMTPTSIAEAMQQALEQRQAELAAQQEQERMTLIQQDLAEADQFLQQMMAMVGQEAMTADGGAAVPADPMGAQMPQGPMGAPGGAPDGGGMAAAMSGLGGLPAGAGALGPGGGGGQLPPEQLAQLLGAG